MQEIYNKVAQQLNIPKERISKVYTAYWYYIRQYISQLPLKNIDNIEGLSTSINIPSLGKLHCTQQEFTKKKKKYEAKKDKANV